MLFKNYFALSEVTEPSRLLHRWCALSLISGVVGTNIWVRYGQDKLYPNLYVAIVGTMSSKATAAIELLKAAYATSRKELIVGEPKIIWEDLQDKQPTDKIVEAMLEGDPLDVATFLSCLVPMNRTIDMMENCYEYVGIYKGQGKGGKSAYFASPRVNLITATTPDIFAQVFPSNNLNTKLLSHFIIINGGNPVKKLPWPLPYDEHLMKRVCEAVHNISLIKGEVTVSPTAKELLELSYMRWVSPMDARLMPYSATRQQQLIKLCMLLAAEKYSLEITKPIVVDALKILTFAESQMPLALGEYGTDKQSHVRGRIMHFLNTQFPKTVSMSDIYRAIHQDVKDMNEAATHIHSLVQAGRIVASGRAFAPVRHVSNFDTEFNLDCSTLWEF